MKNDLTKSAALLFAVFVHAFGFGMVISVLVRSKTLPKPRVTTPNARVALARVLDLTKSTQMTAPKERDDRTKTRGPYQKRDKNTWT